MINSINEETSIFIDKLDTIRKLINKSYLTKNLIHSDLTIHLSGTFMIRCRPYSKKFDFYLLKGNILESCNDIDFSKSLSMEISLLNDTYELFYDTNQKKYGLLDHQNVLIMNSEQNFFYIPYTCGQNWEFYDEDVDFPVISDDHLWQMKENLTNNIYRHISLKENRFLLKNIIFTLKKINPLYLDVLDEFIWEIL